LLGLSNTGLSYSPSRSLDDPKLCSSYFPKRIHPSDDSIQILFSSPEDAPSPFFTAFWAAVDGRALTSLHRTAAGAAFLSSLLECAILLIKRIQSSKERSQPTVDETGWIKELFSRVWTELSDQKLKLEDRMLANIIPRTLGVLMDLSRIVFDVAWEALAIQMKISAESGKKDAAKLVSVLLKALVEGSSDSNTQVENKRYLKEKADELLKAISKDDIERVERLVHGSSEEKTTNFDMIEEFLKQFKEGLFVDQVLASVRGINCIVELESDPDLRSGMSCFPNMPSRYFHFRPTCYFLISYIEKRKQGAKLCGIPFS
jgi:hypothetical protein